MFAISPISVLINLTVATFTFHIVHAYDAPIHKLSFLAQVAIVAFLWTTRLALLASVLLGIVGLVFMILAGAYALAPMSQADSN